MRPALISSIFKRSGATALRARPPSLPLRGLRTTAHLSHAAIPESHVLLLCPKAQVPDHLTAYSLQHLKPHQSPAPPPAQAKPESKTQAKPQPQSNAVAWLEIINWLAFAAALGWCTYEFGRHKGSEETRARLRALDAESRAELERREERAEKMRALQALQRGGFKGDLSALQS